MTRVFRAGWNLCDGASGRPDVRGRLLKGAGTGANGGTPGGSATHGHTLASHGHGTTYAHDHPGVTSSQRTGALSTGTISGGAANVATATHTHALTFGSTSPAITSTGDTASTVAHTPPFVVLACLQNTSGTDSWPDGVLALWTGTLASLPEDWHLCDGTDGTPDLRSLFIQAATTLGDIGTTGGSLTHSHTLTGHTHAVAAHTHTVTGGLGASESRTAGAVNAALDTHTHTWAATSSNGFTSGSATPTVTHLTDTQPPFTTVVIVQWQAPAPVGLTVVVPSVTETTTTQPVVWSPQARLATLVTETSTPQAVTWSPKVRGLSQVIETATGQVVGWAPKARSVATVTANETSQGLTWAPLTRLLSPPVELATVQPVLWRPLLRLVSQVLATETAASVPPALARLLAERGRDRHRPGRAVEPPGASGEQSDRNRQRAEHRSGVHSTAL